MEFRPGRLFVETCLISESSLSTALALHDNGCAAELNKQTKKEQEKNKKRSKKNTKKKQEKTKKETNQLAVI